MKEILQIFIYVFITLAASAQQSTSIDFFENSGFDKVLISTYSVKDKTFFPPEKVKLVSLDSLKNNVNDSFKTKVIKSSSKKVTERKLKKKQVKKLIKKLRKKLISVYAMDANENIKIDFYKNDIIFQKIILSSNTKNIKIKKEGCKTKMVDGIEQNPCLYLGKMTLEFESYINCLLKKRDANNSQ